ncbi:hypothetical protein K523DRAFT_408524 [Schizophyllum commune Tattone D]|nr:hypothetical protein K523DRAFT_408524 [Schizophyllum commune Tattone D]
MAASPTTAQQQATLSEAYGDQDGPPTSDSQSAAQPLGDDLRGDRDADNGNNDYARSDVGDSVKAENTRLGKPNPNKVYIGGLPESTRTEDLKNCFGKLGAIVNIELKIGYGFVEFDNPEAAIESVNKYHEGYFMGNKIRVEISKGGSKSRHAMDPGSCFRCGVPGHWARECPTYPGPPPGRRVDPVDRVRDRDPRDRDYPPPPPREYRRPVTPPYPPPREYRDYPPMPPRRDYDDYARRPPPVDYRDPRYPPPPVDYRYAPPPPVDPYRGYPPPPVADRGDRRLGPVDPRYAATPMATPRARTPPRYRDDYERPPPRDYEPRRGRPVTPPVPAAGRYDYAAPPPRNGGYRFASPSASLPYLSDTIVDVGLKARPLLALPLTTPTAVAMLSLGTLAATILLAAWPRTATGVEATIKLAVTLSSATGGLALANSGSAQTDSGLALTNHVLALTAHVLALANESVSSDLRENNLF